MSKQIIEGVRHTYFGADPNSVIVIGADTTHKSKAEHPSYDDRVHEELDRPWIENLKRLGILQPITVRKEGDDAVVVAGRRRTLGLRIANAELVKEGKPPHPLLIMAEKGTTDLEVLEKKIAENEGRKQTSPLQKSQHLKDWFEANPDGTDNEAAAVFNTTATTIRNWKKGWDLSPRVTKAVQSGKATFESATNLADLSHEEQDAKLRELVQASGGAKITSAHTEGERKQRKASVAATAYAPPSMSKVRKIAESDELLAALDPVVVRVIKYLSGLSDGADLPELKGLVDATAARGKIKTGPKLSGPQEQILATLDESKEKEVLHSSLKAKPLAGLMKLGIVERFEGPDGLLYVRRNLSGVSNGAPVENGQGGPPAEAAPAAAEVQNGNGKGHEADPVPAPLDVIPSAEEIETMSSKDFNALGKRLQIPNWSKLKAEDKVKAVLKLKKSRDAAAKRKAAAQAPPAAEA